MLNRVVHFVRNEFFKRAILGLFFIYLTTNNTNFAAN